MGQLRNLAILPSITYHFQRAFINISNVSLISSLCICIDSSAHLSNSLCCRVVVGAPQANTPAPGVVKGGAVFRCAADLEGDCNMLPFDTHGE